jgi:hypothetical protein
LWNINGLIEKLVQVDAVEKKRNRGLAFSVSFRKFIVCRLRDGSINVRTLEGWRIIFASYHYSLISLSAEEVGATVVLLEYYFQNSKQIAPAKDR